MPSGKPRLRHRKPNPNERVLRPVRPNAGIESAFRRRLLAEIAKMHASITWWVEAAYKRNEPEIAQDAPGPDAGGGGFGPQDEGSPARVLQAAIRRLRKRWQKGFDELAPKLAEHYAQAVGKRSDAALRAMLKEAGFTVEFRMTRAMNDVMNATIGQQVSLIKSIPQKYLLEVEGAVMRSVQTGRDLGSLSKELQHSYGVTKRRAAFIARDQVNKATASMHRARLVELGVTEAVWMHSGGGREPRPSHVKAGREKARYDVAKGWFDPHEQKFILPGELVNCRCVSRPVLPGFS